MKRYTLIVAGGRGKRMGAGTPKQFLPLAGVPVLFHTLRAFHRFDKTMGIILVLPQVQLELWESLCEQHQLQVPHQLAIGGQSRFHSVKNGLELAEDNSLIAIHDGVRPLVSKQVIKACFQAAEEHGCVVPVTEITSSLRKISTDGSNVVDRNQYRKVQTPQCFKSEWIKTAYEQPFDSSFTDDASVAEAAGYKVHLVEGSPSNIKITTPADLKLAELLLTEGQSSLTT